MYIVLVTKGKREAVDYATVKLFSNKDDALKYIECTSELGKKYWTKAELVSDSVEIELVDGYYGYGDNGN